MPDDRIRPGLIGSFEEPQDPCIRAESEDDDGYDPYSDRLPEPEPLFEPDPFDPRVAECVAKAVSDAVR